MKLFVEIKSKVFLRILLSYALILLIPILINVRTHTMSVEAIREKSIEYNTNQLAGIVRNVEERLHTIQDTSQQLPSRGNGQGLASACVPLGETSPMDPRESIGAVFDGLDGNGIFVADGSYLLNFPEYGPDSSHGDKAADSPSSDKMLYRQTRPNSYSPQGDIVPVSEIPKEDIQSLLEAVQSERSFSFVQDRDGSRLVSCGDSSWEAVNLSFPRGSNHISFKANNENVIATYVVSDYTGWTYATLTPESEMYDSLPPIQRNYYLTIGAILVLGIGMAFVFTRSNTQPIIKATETLSTYLGVDRQESPSARDPYSLITTGVAQLIAKQTALQEDLLQQKSRLRSSMLGELLAGHFYSEDELSQIAESLDLPLKGSAFYLGLVSIYSDSEDDSFSAAEEELSARKEMIQRELAQAFGDKLILHEPDQKRIALIFNLTAMELEQCNFEEFLLAAMEEVNTTLFREHSTELFMGFSECGQSINDLWRLLSQAEQALQCAWEDSRTVFCSGMTAQTQIYYYPAEVEQWLIHAAGLGDYEQIEHNLDILYRENVLQRRLSSNARQELLLAMYATLNQLVEAIPDSRISVNPRDIRKNRRASDSFDAVKALYKKVCERQTSGKDSARQLFIAEVTDYIEKNYMDSTKGLYSMATHFNLSEGYFSLFFKENMGVNFIEYLEKVRLTKSVELLQTTNLTIDAIAAKVGYNSGQSYRRAFKKIYSCSPTQLRNQLKGNP